MFEINSTNSSFSSSPFSATLIPIYAKMLILYVCDM